MSEKKLEDEISDLYSAPREAIAVSRTDHHSSGVSWGAVIGGAFITASIALIMLALGAGFGLSTVSPWSNAGAASAGTAAISWLIVIEIVSCALGGYLAGRLRTKWVSIHTDEVYFRDTANGFLVWAVALVITVIFLASAASNMVGEAGRQERMPNGTATATTAVDPNGYFVDTLFRSDAAHTSNDVSAQAEAARIFAHTLWQTDPNAADLTYLSKLVAAKTGLSQADAETRVSQVVNDARQAEDRARKMASHLLLWIFLALLIGAFSASYAATIGGRQRDHVKLI